MAVAFLGRLLKEIGKESLSGVSQNIARTTGVDLLKRRVRIPRNVRRAYNIYNRARNKSDIGENLKVDKSSRNDFIRDVEKVWSSATGKPGVMYRIHGEYRSALEKVINQPTSKLWGALGRVTADKLERENIKIAKTGNTVVDANFEVIQKQMGILSDAFRKFDQKHLDLEEVMNKKLLAASEVTIRHNQRTSLVLDAQLNNMKSTMGLYSNKIESHDRQLDRLIGDVSFLKARLRGSVEEREPEPVAERVREKEDEKGILGTVVDLLGKILGSVPGLALGGAGLYGIKKLRDTMKLRKTLQARKALKPPKLPRKGGKMPRVPKWLRGGARVGGRFAGIAGLAAILGIEGYEMFADYMDGDDAAEGATTDKPTNEQEALDFAKDIKNINVNVTDNIAFQSAKDIMFTSIRSMTLTSDRIDLKASRIFFNGVDVTKGEFEGIKPPEKDTGKGAEPQKQGELTPPSTEEQKFARLNGGAAARGIGSKVPDYGSGSAEGRREGVPGGGTAPNFGTNVDPPGSVPTLPSPGYQPPGKTDDGNFNWLNPWTWGRQARTGTATMTDAQPTGATRLGVAPGGTPDATRTQDGAWKVENRVDRSRFKRELEDTRTLQAVASRMKSEVGSQGRMAQVMWLESLYNRASARNQTLLQAVTGPYYPTHDPGRINDSRSFSLIKEVADQGYDYTKGATGNASGDVGFGYGKAKKQRDGSMWAPGQTAAHGGERFGREARDAKWVAPYKQVMVDPKTGKIAFGPTSGTAASPDQPSTRMEGRTAQPFSFGANSPWSPQGGKSGAPLPSNEKMAKINRARPNHFGGTLELEGVKYAYGTGSRRVTGGAMGRGSVPYGTYGIKSGLHSGANPRYRNNSFYVNDMFDPKWGKNRSAILIHSSRSLDALYSAGCIAVRRDQWPRFKAHLLDAMKRNGGQMAIQINPDGSARIAPRTEFTKENIKPESTDRYLHDPKVRPKTAPDPMGDFIRQQIPDADRQRPQQPPPMPSFRRGAEGVQGAPGSPSGPSVAKTEEILKSPTPSTMEVEGGQMATRVEPPKEEPEKKLASAEGVQGAAGSPSGPAVTPPNAAVRVDKQPQAPDLEPKQPQVASAEYRDKTPNSDTQADQGGTMPGDSSSDPSITYPSNDAGDSMPPQPGDNGTGDYRHCLI